MFDRITFDSKIMGGRACIRGMRIPVSVVVGQIAHGAIWDEVLQGYPDLEREDIQQGARIRRLVNARGSSNRLTEKAHAFPGRYGRIAASSRVVTHEGP